MHSDYAARLDAAQGGDLFEMRGQLTETEVAQLLRQLLNGVLGNFFFSFLGLVEPKPGH